MNNKKILLIDDDKDDQLFFVDVLEEIDPSITCFVADDGHKGIGHLERQSPPPDVIFLDLNMPGLNGLECLHAVKLIEQHKNIPVIIFTTSSNPNDKEKAMQLGAQYFLTKPPDYLQLKNIMKDLIDKL